MSTEARSASAVEAALAQCRKLAMPRKLRCRREVCMSGLMST
jgi:hypothetical protein